MNKITLFCRDNDSTLAMHDDVFERIGLDLNELRLTGYAVVDEGVVLDYFKNLESFDYSSDDYEESDGLDYDFDSIFAALANIIRKIAGIEVEVRSMEDGLYIRDWHRLDEDEVMMMAA